MTKCSYTLVHPGIVDESKTSDYYKTCQLPTRFEYPARFKSYGIDRKPPPHPFYNTTSGDYGKYPPSVHDVPNIYFPTSQKFTKKLGACGMYKNYSLNTALDPKPC